MKINQQQIESVLALPSEKRYQYFVKLAADREEVWGLYDDGWALAGTDTDTKILPLWPTKEYASLCAKDEWAEYIPEPIDLDEFLSEFLPGLKDAGILPGIFYTPIDKAVTPTIERLLNDITAELKNY